MFLIVGTELIHVDLIAGRNPGDLILQLRRVGIVTAATGAGESTDQRTIDGTWGVRERYPEDYDLLVPEGAEVPDSRLLYHFRACHI